ncbi:DUF5658 family protein [Halorarum halobium]|uniref:DUF5658 family protein n=1 Tax=Halorarum halobium TaxID=3075121 RepID=UPI0028A71C5A|nr:DUF5658 family protein [Halobaculum sp. XH14]
MSRAFGEETIRYFTARSAYLWLGAVLFFVCGDLVTTTIGLSLDQVVEVGPVAAYVLTHGYVPLVVLKGLTVALCVGLWRLTPRPHRVGVPLGLATLGVLVTVWNTWILFVAST